VSPDPPLIAPNGILSPRTVTVRKSEAGAPLRWGTRFESCRYWCGPSYILGQQAFVTTGAAVPTGATNVISPIPPGLPWTEVFRKPGIRAPSVVGYFEFEA
jgi:hypothetical protein